MSEAGYTYISHGCVLPFSKKGGVLACLVKLKVLTFAALLNHANGLDIHFPGLGTVALKTRYSQMSFFRLFLSDMDVDVIAALFM